MAEITALNGQPIAAGTKVSLVLEYDKESGALQMGGDALSNVDRALNILAQAHRYLDAQYRNGQLMRFQAELAQNERLVGMIRQ